MKTIMIASFLFLSTSFYAQQEGSQDSTNAKPYLSRVTVELDATNTNAEGSVLDMELFRMLSDSWPVSKMTTVLDAKYNMLHVTFNFNDNDTFINWYEDEETKEMFKMIYEKFGDYNIVINFSKQVITR
ncbi:MAG: hypothetical protein GXO85_12080 [Chlorobi bacterium]|nr:hypothetical protein [Chlorobiota bacterium]